jgi:ethanolamine permease
MEENKLKKALTPAGIWAVAVGAVVSGNYYGWNYIFSETNFIGALIAMAIACLFYVPFAFMYAELATAIPSSAGPAAYTEKAFGRGPGFFAGFSYLVESLFCTPGICIAVGAYVHTMFPVVPAVVGSVITYLIFLYVNCRGIEAGQKVGLVVTVIGVAGCALFAVVGLPHADFTLLGKMGELGGVKGIFVAIPYAVWFFLAFEAGGMGAEECKNPSKDIPKAFIVSIATLFLAGMAMLFTTAGILPKDQILQNDAPVANVINYIFGQGSAMSILFIIIAMIGLVASLNGIIIGQSRQTYALARCKCLPSFLGKLDKNGTPINALLTTSIIGIVFTIIGSVAVIVVIANMGSAFMALCCFASWLKLRKSEPNMKRPYTCKMWIGITGIPFCIIVAFCSLYSAVTAGLLFYFAVAFFVIAIAFYLIVCKNKNGTFLVEPEDQLD